MDPDPDFLDQIQIFGHSGSRQKKSYLDRGKKPGSETLVFITQI